MQCHRLLAATAALVLTALPSFAVQSAGAGPTTVSATTFAPNALLTIDQNRTTVVDRIVATWGDALVAADAGLTKEQLRALLAGLRSDQLLAASLAGSLDGLRNVIANALTANVPVAAGLIHTKVLGDAGDDLVYTPLTPCRIVDTRNVGGPFAAGGETRNYHAYLTSGTFATQGGTATDCGVPANPSVVTLNITTVGGGSFLTAWPFNTTRPLASTLNPTPGIVADAALLPICAPSCAFEFSVFTFGAYLIVDIVGYFRAPGGAIGTVSNIATGTGLTGGPITTTGTLSLASSYQLPQSCTNGQVPKSNGAGGWTCGADADSGGTVTSVGTGSGLTGGPITAVGTINLAATNLLPTVACTTNQIPKWNGSAWTCAADAGGGTVTSVGTGAGLTGGPITGSGTISLASGGVGTAQLAPNAVTQAILSATGGTSGQVLTTNGTQLVWQTLPQIVNWNGDNALLYATSATFVFLGAGATITVPAATSRRVTANGFADLYVLAGSASVYLNICYQNQAGPGAVNEFSSGGYMIPVVTTNGSVFSTGDSAVLTSGTYKVALCIRNTSPTTVHGVWTSGWVMMTNS